MKAESTLSLASPAAWERPRLTNAIPFLLVHAACLGAFLVPFEAWYVGLCCALEGRELVPRKPLPLG